MLFDKVSGTSTSYNSSGITDSSASWTINQFQNWYVTINSTEYLIESNTVDTLTFSNTLSADADYEIAIVGREYLEEIESDGSNTTKISDDLISKKYNQANIKLNNAVEVYLRKLCTSEFDPLENILNIDKMQQSYAYYMLFLIYSDLKLGVDTFNQDKSDGFYQEYKALVRDALALLVIDFDEDGEADCDEKNVSAGGITLVR